MHTAPSAECTGSGASRTAGQLLKSPALVYNWLLASRSKDATRGSWHRY